MAAQAATEVTVCSFGCDYSDLATAVSASDADRIVVQPQLGEPLFVYESVRVDRQVEIVGSGVSMFSMLNGDPMFDVRSGGAGTSIHGFVIGASFTLGDTSGIVRVAADAVAMYDLSVSEVEGQSPLIKLEAGSLTLSNSTFDGTRLNGGGGALWTSGGSLTVRDTTFSGSEVQGAELLYAAGSVVSLERVSVTDTTAGQLGSVQIQADGASLTMIDTEVTAVASGYGAAGGVLYATNGELVVRGGRWTTNGSVTQATLSNMDNVTLDGLAFDSVVASEVDVLELTDVVARSGWISITGADQMTVTGSWFCGQLITMASDVTVTRSVFQQGGFAAVDGEAHFDHSTFLDTVGPSLTMIDAVWSADHSLFVGASGAPAVSGSPPPELFEWNVFADNFGRLTDFGYGADLNPELAVEFVEEPGRCGVSVSLTSGTDPWVIDNDIGAEPPCGSTEVPGDGWDNDCDGYELCPVDEDDDLAGSDDEFDEVSAEAGWVQCEFAPDDCDDADPDVHPGAEDEWYDGIDADCAGDDDNDRDQDGLRHPADCDDRDPKVGRCALSLSGGCDTAGGAPGWALVAGLAAAVGRRRARGAGRARVLARPDAGRV
ncbi:MAG: MopE-related protein [Myxococcota bacterium]